MANRAQRRAQGQRGRSGSAGGSGRATPRAIRPQGSQHGIEVNVEGGLVYLTLYAGEVTTTVGWLASDAKRITELLLDGIRQTEGHIEKSPEVVKESGLVVARTLPPS